MRRMVQKLVDPKLDLGKNCRLAEVALQKNVCSTIIRHTFFDVAVKEVYACTRLALKSSCMPDSSKPQEVFRWYRDGDKCKIYRFNYCEMEAHVPPYPLKEQKDCERLCIGKQSDFVPVPT